VGELNKLEKQVDSLKNSKQNMQATLSEQLNSVSVQLDKLKYEKRKCDEVISDIKIENDRLKLIIQREQNRNKELLMGFRKWINRIE